MNTYIRTLYFLSQAALALSLVATVPLAWAQEEFDATKVLIEINASDGDIGFHTLFDAGAWKKVTMKDPDGKMIFQDSAKGSLRKQGLTENFFESAEPLCFEDEEERVVLLSEFLDRFPAGEYSLLGKTIEGEVLLGEATLTYNLPVAPVDLAFDEETGVISWAAGSDLGECEFDGLVPDPVGVEVVGWEVAFEAEDDELLTPNRKFTVQLPPDTTSVTVPAEYLDTLIADGVEVFKFEVGAIEASGNQTFSEAEFPEE